MSKEIKLSSPLNHAKEIQQAIRDLRRADELAEHAAVRIFSVFRELKFGESKGPDEAVAKLNRAHDQLGDARFALNDACDQLVILLRRAGFTVPAK